MKSTISYIALLLVGCLALFAYCAYGFRVRNEVILMVLMLMAMMIFDKK